MFFRPHFVNTSKKRVLVQIESLAGENVCEISVFWKRELGKSKVVVAL